MDRKHWADEELDRSLARATARGAVDGPIATSARYSGGRVVVVLDSGVELRFPPSLAQGLGGAKPRDLSDIRIEAGGLSLRWPKLDADLYVPSLAKGILGSRGWMARIGRLGGTARSSAKARAARQNGLKGGRPRKLRRAA